MPDWQRLWGLLCCMAENDGNNGWAEDNRAVISRATEPLMDAMDQIEDRGEAYKHLIWLNALRGTSTVLYTGGMPGTGTRDGFSPTEVVFPRP